MSIARPVSFSLLIVLLASATLALADASGCVNPIIGGSGCTVADAQVTAPEPGTLSIVVLGLIAIALGVVGRRRARR